MSNLITYKAGYSNLENTESWENAIEIGGEGVSYSAGIFRKKEEKQLVG